MLTARELLIDACRHDRSCFNHHDKCSRQHIAAFIRFSCQTFPTTVHAGARESRPPCTPDLTTILQRILDIAVALLNIAFGLLGSAFDLLFLAVDHLASLLLNLASNLLGF